MTGMKRRTAIAVTLVVWVAALGSAGALTYDLRRPSPLAVPAARLAPPVDPASAVVAEPVAELQSVLSVPTITVVGYPPRHSAAVASEPAPKVSPMRCADWRELHMGSGRVQVCE